MQRRERIVAAVAMSATKAVDVAVAICIVVTVVAELTVVGLTGAT